MGINWAMGSAALYKPTTSGVLKYPSIRVSVQDMIKLNIVVPRRGSEKNNKFFLVALMLLTLLFTETNIGSFFMVYTTKATQVIIIDARYTQSTPKKEKLKKMTKIRKIGNSTFLNTS
jgi:hypothetical protein